MIYEIATLPVKTDLTDSFKRAFDELTPLLSRAHGYEGHRLMQGIETPSHFTLIVQWQTLETHTEGFEPSEDHQLFMAGLQAYLAAEPSVYHVRMAFPTSETALGPDARMN